jgi:TolB protein
MSTPRTARSLRSLAVFLGVVALAGAWAAARVSAQGDVRIDVKSGAIARLPLRCESLQGPQSGNASARDADGVLANDLQNSAVFEVDRQWAPSANDPQPQFVTSGRWSVEGSQVKLAGELRDFPARRPILVRDYSGPASDWRRVLHRFSDDCVQQITGERGVADTRVAFVVKEGQNKELWIMDADGANARALTADKSIVQSPSWSPEGSLLLFTSWRAGNGPAVWVMSPEQRKPYLISGRPGLNTSAAYSPDGQKIACTLSQDGNAEIYVLDARGGGAQRLTNHRSIDTAPAWSPTGRELAFTSDRSGSPQIYLMDAVGGSIRRLTFDVDYTDSPAWSPKGDRIAFVTRVGGGFDVWTCRADGTGAKPAVTGGNNENPRWSADGRHLVFASDRDGGYGLWVTDLDGAVPRKLDTGGHRSMSPAWSPRRSTGS